MPDDSTRSHRFNVNFSDRDYRDIGEWAERQGKTKGQVIRDALALARWFDEAQRHGGRVLVERDGQRREVIFR